MCVFLLWPINWWFFPGGDSSFRVYNLHLFCNWRKVVPCENSSFWPLESILMRFPFPNFHISFFWSRSFFENITDQESGFLNSVAFCPLVPGRTFPGYHVWEKLYRLETYWGPMWVTRGRKENSQVPPSMVYVYGYIVFTKVWQATSTE